MFDRVIEYAAKKTPDKIAIRSFDGAMTFARMDADINRLAHALLKQFEGKKIPQLVAVSYQQVHPHWVFLMALSRIGIASASVAEDSLIAAKEIAILKPDLIISDFIFDIDTDVEILVLDIDWYSEVVLGPEVTPIRLCLKPDRIVRSAIAMGTSKERHRIDFTADMMEANLLRMIAAESTSWTASNTLQDNLTLLPTFSFGSFHGFLAYLIIWSLSGKIIMVDAEQYPAAIMMLNPTYLIISPLHLQSIMGLLPQDFAPMKDLCVVVSSGHFPQKLREAVQQKLTKNIYVIYAASECGTIASIHVDQLTHDNAAGWIPPWVDLEIVDDTGSALPCDEIGNIRIKSRCVEPTLYHDPEAAKKQFKDGWFYPGDLGSLTADGMVRLFGRTDDLYNFGGNKVNANKFDIVVRDIPGVKDAAMFSVPNDSMIDEPWLAIVRGENFDIDLVSEILDKEFYYLQDVNVMWVNQIPRDYQDHTLRYQLTIIAVQKVKNKK